MKQKKISFIFLFIFCTSNALLGRVTEWPEFDKSFFTVRPPFQTASPEKESFFYDKVFLRKCGFNGTMQVVPFGGISTKGKDLGFFFSPLPVTPLIVSSETTNIAGLPQNFNRDINPVHFNIHYVISDIQFGTFNSLLSFNPQQKAAGFGFTYNQFLHPRDACEKHWWFEISCPFLWIKNNMRLEENRVLTTGTPLEGTKVNMVDAFKGGTEQTDIKAGKIDGAKNHAGVADVELKIGYKILNTKNKQFDVYTGGIMPTGNKPRGEFMFEPVVGNNKHWGIMLGGMIDLEFWSNANSSLSFRTHPHGRYLFNNTQTRLIDLKNRPWSRYMLMYANQEAASQGISAVINGTQILLQRLKVHPGFAFTLNNMLRYDHCDLQIEVGYNFYARQAEKLQLKDPWQEGPAVADLRNVFVANVINRLSNIGNNNAGAGTPYSNESRIREEDLGLFSAAHPCAISHTIFGACGYQWPDLCIPVFASVGGSYEFSALNTVLNRWLVWGKVGIAL
ncbi:MAG: hypothetical protein AB7R69_04145 [Candidatus Babeliales bacterium]